MNRYIVDGDALGGRLEVIVWAKDEEHAADLARRAGLSRVNVARANRAMARTRRVFGVNRRRPRLMTVPRGSA